MTRARDVERAIDAIRRGWPVSIDGRRFLPIESSDEGAFERFAAHDSTRIVISGPRAVTLKLANQIEGTPTGAVIIESSPWIDFSAAGAIADPQRDLSTPLKGPFRTLNDPQPHASAAAMKLARLAGLLPAFFVNDLGSFEQGVSSQDIIAYAQSSAVRIASRARLPVRDCGQAEIIAFRSEGDAAEQIALMIGAPTGRPPLVRIHSECLTGDALGSLKCDCGPQLRDAISAIRDSGWGILLYLRQEGRGIGLINKLRAYSLQDQGFDTVDANIRLGFADDERNFDVAASMLRKLGQDEVRLLTNNPRKVAALVASGIPVQEQVPLRTGLNPFNKDYLETKRDRSGHQL